MLVGLRGTSCCSLVHTSSHEYAAKGSRGLDILSSSCPSAFTPSPYPSQYIFTLPYSPNFSTHTRCRCRHRRYIHTGHFSSLLVPWIPPALTCILLLALVGRLWRRRAAESVAWRSVLDEPGFHLHIIHIHILLPPLIRIHSRGRLQFLLLRRACLLSTMEYLTCTPFPTISIQNSFNHNHNL